MWLTVLFFVCCLLISSIYGQDYNSYGWPICANATYALDGTIDVAKMLYNCVENIPSSLFPSSYYPAPETGQYSTVNISMQYAINNLISVDDIRSQVTLDFYFRLSWQDPRIYLPDIWTNLNPETQLDGIAISNYVLNDANPLNIWLPDLYFIDATEENIIVQTIKLRPYGNLYWSRHYQITLAQPQMNFQSFPLDSQNFSIRSQSYSYDTKFIQLKYVTPSIVLLKDTQNNDQANIKMNALWNYDDFTSYISNEIQPIYYNPTRLYSVAYANLKFTRQSTGYIIRLGLPVIISLIVVGFSFWSDIEKRIEVTLQMLLVAAALYLVIGQIIPFVGYLTTMDLFITTVFLSLALTVGIHFYTLYLHTKHMKKPMNEFYKYVLVIVLRSFWIPIALLMYMSYFQQINMSMISILCITSVITLSDGLMHYHRIHKLWIRSILNLREKEKYILEQQEEQTKKEQELYEKKYTNKDNNNEEHLMNISFMKHKKRLQLSSLELWLLKYTKHKYSKEEKIFQYMKKIQESQLLTKQQLQQQQQNNFKNNNSSTEFAQQISLDSTNTNLPLSYQLRLNQIYDSDDELDFLDNQSSTNNSNNHHNNNHHNNHQTMNSTIELQSFGSINNSNDVIINNPLTSSDHHMI